MSSITWEKSGISVWFVCRSCELTCSFRTVDEFLDHKKQEHFSEFKNTHSIVFEERKQLNDFSDDENHTIQDEEIKLFAENEGDIDIERCSNTKTILSLVAESLVPPVLKSVAPQSSGSNVVVRHTNSVLEIPNPSLQKECESNYANFDLFSMCSNNPASHSCDLELEVGHNLNPNLNEAPASQTHRQPQFLQAGSSTIEENSAVNLSKSWNLDFSFTDTDADADTNTAAADADASDDDTKFEVDAIPNLENNTSILKNPSVLLRRLSQKELLPSSSFGSTNGKIKLNISNLTTKTKEDSLEPTTCKDCLKPFKTEFGLNRHLKSHNKIKSGPQSFKCSYTDCPSTFITNQQLKLHEKKCHADKNVNSKSSVNKSCFNFSLLKRGQGLNCQSDPVTSQDSREEQTPLEKSNSSDHGPIAVGVKPPIKCGLCDENLESESEAKVHVASCWLQNKSKNCYCAQCNKTLSCPSAFQYHIRSKHIEGRRRSTKPKINCTVEREHKCHICSKTFNRSHILRCHLKTHLPQEERERPFICEICGTTFSVKFNLTTHLKTHSDERPFKCSHPDCGAAFKINARLAMHLKSHSERLFACPKDGCSRQFKTKQGLREHLKTLFHTGVHKPKTWKCKQGKCDKLYLLKTSLDWHMIVAHGIGGKVPTLECDICKKTFKGKKCLTKHYLQTHTGERAYICSYDSCDKAYKDKDALVKHLREQHTGERPFQCEVCGKAYCNRARLKFHMKFHQKS